MLQQAVALLRKRWTSNNYFDDSGGVCMAGAVALVHVPTLRPADGVWKWEHAVFNVLRNDPLLRACLEAEADPRLIELEPKFAKKLAIIRLIEDDVDRTGMKVCLTNLTKIRNGGEAAEMLLSVERRMRHSAQSA